MEGNALAYNSKKIAGIVVVIIILLAGLYTAITFPRTLVELQFSFAIGAEQQLKEFELPILHSEA